MNTINAIRHNTPFLGLRYFDEEHEALFFGRQEQLRDLLNKIETSKFVTVIGSSGIGKSSLVRAGLIPGLRAGFLTTAGSNWRIVKTHPGLTPIANLAQELESIFQRPGMELTLRRGSLGLVDAAVQCQLGEHENLMVVVDQFEEVFRYQEGTEDLAGVADEYLAFVRLLLAATVSANRRIYVLITMRSEYLGACAQFPDLPERINTGLYLIPRMRRHQLEEAITGPVAALGVSFSPALVQKLLNDAAEAQDQLPVFQHALLRTWLEWKREGRPDEPIDFRHYDAIGGLHIGIDKHAEEIYSQLSEHDKKTAETIFRCLTERDQSNTEIRRPTSLGVIAYLAGLSVDEVSRVADVFRKDDVCFLKPSLPADLNRDTILDLTHESLMWHWSRLKRWIDAEGKQSSQIRFFYQAACEKNLLSGPGLESALQWRDQNAQKYVAQRYMKPGELERTEDWIDQSERIQRKQLIYATLRRIAGWLGIVSVLAIALSTFAIWKRKNWAQARELNAWAAASLDQDPERSLILELYSWSKQGTVVPGLEQFLHQAILKSLSQLTLRGHQSRILGVVWSPDGTKLATASGDSTAKVWDAATGHELYTLHGHQDAVWTIAWSPDGAKLATGAADRTAKVWDASTGRELHTLHGHQDAVWTIAWSPDGTKLATGSADKTAKVWDAVTGEELRTLAGHQKGIRSIGWNAVGTRLATGGDDCTVRLWEPSAGSQLLSVTTNSAVGCAILSIAWSPDGNMLAAASYQGDVNVWRMPNGQQYLNIPQAHQRPILGIAWSPNGKELATASYDGTAKVWEAGTGRQLVTLHGHEDRVLCVTWAPDGNRLATGSYDQTVRVWEPWIGHELAVLTGHQSGILGIGWSPDGHKVGTASKDNTAKIWDASTGRMLLTLSGHQAAVSSIAWSPAGDRVATASSDHTARIWDANEGLQISILIGHTQGVRGIAWSPDGKKLATASEDKTVKIWDAGTGREQLTLSGHQGTVSAIAWSADGKKLATSSDDQTARIWDSDTGRELFVLRGHHRPVSSVAWSPDSRKLATASWDNSAKIWDANSARELLTLHGHKSFVNSIAWSPDGRRLATASDDKALKLWDVVSGHALLTLEAHQSSVNNVAWSPDGKRLASVGDDMIAQVYAIATDDLLRLAKSRIGRSLTPEECRTFMNNDKCPPLPDIP